jgi:hypothetical protein
MIKITLISISIFTGCLLSFQWVDLKKIDIPWTNLIQTQPPGESDGEHGLSHREMGGF